MGALGEERGGKTTEPGNDMREESKVCALRSTVPGKLNSTWGLADQRIHASYDNILVCSVE